MCVCLSLAYLNMYQIMFWILCCYTTYVDLDKLHYSYLFVPMRWNANSLLRISHDKLSIVVPSNGWWILVRLDYFQNATLKFELTTRLNTSFVVARNGCSGICKWEFYLFFWVFFIILKPKVSKYLNSLIHLY